LISSESSSGIWGAGAVEEVVVPDALTQLRQLEAGVAYISFYGKMV